MLQVNKGLPSDDLPRLVCASGRTESAVAKILDDLESRTVDIEEVRLWHAIHSEDIGGHVVRGYTLLGKIWDKKQKISIIVQDSRAHNKNAICIYKTLPILN